jgi:hypothetical protein
MNRQTTDRHRFYDREDLQSRIKTWIDRERCSHTRGKNECMALIPFVSRGFLRWRRSEDRWSLLCYFLLCCLCVLMFHPNRYYNPDEPFFLQDVPFYGPGLYETECLEASSHLQPTTSLAASLPWQDLLPAFTAALDPPSRQPYHPRRATNRLE